MKRHVEMLPARKYYRRENPGHYSKGSVVLINGRCEFHGTTKEAKEFYRKVSGLNSLMELLQTKASEHFGVPKDKVVVTLKKDKRR